MGRGTGVKYIVRVKFFIGRTDHRFISGVHQFNMQTNQLAL